MRYEAFGERKEENKAYCSLVCRLFKNLECKHASLSEKTEEICCWKAKAIAKLS